MILPFSLSGLDFTDASAEPYRRRTETAQFIRDHGRAMQSSRGNNIEFCGPLDVRRFIIFRIESGGSLMGALLLHNIVEVAVADGVSFVESTPCPVIHGSEEFASGDPEGQECADRYGDIIHYLLNEDLSSDNDEILRHTKLITLVPTASDTEKPWGDRGFGLVDSLTVRGIELDSLVSSNDSGAGDITYFRSASRAG